MKIPDYGKVYALGKREVHDIFHHPVVVQEKIDGSQFSFMLDPVSDQLLFKSRNQMLDPDDPPAMFRMAVESVIARRDALLPGAIYRGECVTRPRHNVLSYERIPQGGVILFDVRLTGIQSGDHATLTGLETLAAQAELEAVPSFDVDVTTRTVFDELLETPSCLGGKVEGFVFKSTVLVDPHHRFERLKAKYVTGQFKEKMGSKKVSKRPGASPIDKLIEMYATPARYAKAVQHLREDGRLKDGPEDIGPLMGEVSRDLLEECGAEIDAAILKAYRKQVVKGVSQRLPQWYKDQLTNRQFEDEE